MPTIAAKIWSRFYIWINSEFIGQEDYLQIKEPEINIFRGGKIWYRTYS